MKRLLGCCLCLCVFVAYGQKPTLDVDKTDGFAVNHFYTVSGEPFVNVRYVRLIEGIPYFKDQWMPLVAHTEEGKRFRARQVKLNLLENNLHYLNESGTEMICTFPFKDVILTDSASGNIYHFLHSSYTPVLAAAKTGWYLKLVEGRASLFQFFNKTLQEFKPYGSSVAEQKIYTMEDFAIVNNGMLSIVKKPKDVSLALPNKRKELEEFLKSKDNKNASNAERISALIHYYNTLQ